MNKDVVQRILAVRYTSKPDAAGPSWLTVLGHAKDGLWNVDLFRCESAVLCYHQERPHQGLNNAPTITSIGRGPVRRRERLGGLLKFYYRAAA